MGLPPLANVFAVEISDPELLRSVRARIEADGRADVREVARRWIVAIAPLPGERQLPREGLFFAEGGDVASSAARQLGQFAEHSPERLDEVPGDWTFAHFAKSGQATIARSCGGRVPIYTWQDRRTRGISTLLSDIVRWRTEDPKLDPLTHAMWLAGHMGKPDGRTLLAGVRVLARGHCALFGPKEGLRILPYWDPRPRQPPRALGRVADSVAEAFRDELIAVLGRELDPDLDDEGNARNLGALSGGVDSSALVGLARHQLGRKVSTFSVLPVCAPHRARELSYVSRMTSNSRSEGAFHIPNTVGRRIADARSAPPVATHLLGATAYLHRICRGRQYRVLFGGVGADELCGSAITRSDWMRMMPVSRLFWARELPEGPRDIARRIKSALREAVGGTQPPLLPYRPRLPEYAAKDLSEEYAEWFARYRRQALEDDSCQRAIRQYLERDEFNAVAWEVASVFNIRNSHPFMTRSLIELAYSVHPDDTIGPGTKRLLRRALSGEVPTANLYRADKGTFPNQDGTMIWNQRLPPELEGILRADWFPYPPARINGRDALSLWRLVKFQNSVNTLRSGSKRAALVAGKRVPGLALSQALAPS